MPNIDLGTSSDKSGSANQVFEVTFFFHKNARYKHEVQFTLESLAGQIELEEAASKDQLKWLKLAHFGSVPSADGSLRHNANVQWVSGCEGDYDAGVLLFEDAVSQLEKAGVASIVYTTPSHSQAKPRWRVLCPFSSRLSPDERAHMVARLNGLFGGVLADESFTLSQSYYFGHLSGASDFEVRWIEGACIDQCDELDTGAVGKGRGRAGDGNGQDQGWTSADIEELTRRILAGEALHPSVVVIAGSYAGRGIDISACLDYIALAFTAAHQPRYGGRWDECVAAVSWCYAQEEKKKGRQEAPPAGSLWVDLSQWDGVEPPEQEWSVRDIIPARQTTLFSGHGAAGKSTVALHLACAHTLGRMWLNYDAKYGPAFVLDAEDEASVLHRRTRAILDHYEMGYRDLIDGGLKIMARTGIGATLAYADKNGLLKTTPLYHYLKDAARDEKPVQIIIASAANVFGGSEINRPQVTQFIDLMTALALESGGSVILVAHPSRLGIADDSGYSGSTGWHNSVRAQLYLKGLKNGDEQDESDLRLLEFKKNQYGPPAHTLTLRWKNGLFLPEGGKGVFEKAAIEQKFMELLAQFNKVGRNVSEKPTSRTYAPAVFAKEPTANGITKRDFEAAMKQLFAAGKINVVRYGSPSRGWERIEIASSAS